MTTAELEKTISAYQDGLYRFAFFRTGSEEEAEDIVQNVFINMYKATTKETVINAKAYLYKSVQNACLNWLRTMKPATVALDGERRTMQEDAMQPVLLKEQYKKVQALLKNLPHEQAAVVKLRVIDELSFIEIAELLEEPETTIKSRFKYGIDKLKKIVKSKDYYHEMF